MGILDEAGQNIGSKMLPFTGVSQMSHNLSTYIAKPKLLEQGYDDAAGKIRLSLAAAIAKKTAE